MFSNVIVDITIFRRPFVFSQSHQLQSQHLILYTAPCLSLDSSLSLTLVKSCRKVKVVKVKWPSFDNCKRPSHVKLKRPSQHKLDLANSKKLANSCFRTSNTRYITTHANLQHGRHSAMALGTDNYRLCLAFFYVYRREGTD